MAFFVGEFGVNKSVHEFFRERICNYARAEHEYIRIVMLHSLVGGIGVMAETGPDAYELVSCDGSSYTAAANEDTPLGSPILDGFPDRFGKIGVVDWLRVVGPDIKHIVLLAAEELCDRLLEFESGMVRAHNDPH